MIFKKKNKETNLEKDYVTFKEFKKLKRRINAHESYLNIIHLFYELEPDEFISELKKLSYEIIKFFDNLCLKYDLKYWMDAETLLGAILHEDFLLSYCDFDVSMLKEDFLKLKEVLPSEITENMFINNSENKISIDYKIKEFEEKLFSVNINLFCEDYEELFPLTRLSFGKYEFFSPKNPKEYLKYFNKRFMEYPYKINDLSCFNNYMDDSEVLKKYRKRLVQYV